MKNSVLRTITGLALGLLFLLSFIYIPPFYFSLILGAILAYIIFFEWNNFFNWHQSIFWMLLPLYPVLPFALLIRMNQQPIYRGLLFSLFVLVASHDTGSYIIGSLFGKHRIAPHISPGKTWEGFFGGALLTIASFTLLLWATNTSKPWWLIAGIALATCVLALCGDLFESWLKRLARIKDSGTILPGHGGFLDRFDGILFVVFFFYLFKDHLLLLIGL